MLNLLFQRLADHRHTIGDSPGNEELVPIVAVGQSQHRRVFDRFVHMDGPPIFCERVHPDLAPNRDVFEDILLDRL